MSDNGQTTNPATPPAGTTTPTPPAPDPNASGGGAVGAQGDASLIGGAGATETAPEPFDPAKLKLPEGFKAEGEGFDAFKNIATEAKLSHDTAQKFVELHTKAVESALKGLTDQWAEQQTKWLEEINKDPELGGAKLQGVKETVAKVLDNPNLTPDGKAFREALTYTGAGNNPVVLRTIYSWAKALTEGGSVQGGALNRDGQGNTSANRPSPAEAMYGPTGPHSGGPKLS